MKVDESQPVAERTKLGFTKDQCLRSRQFSLVGKDILAVVLEDGKQYTMLEVKRMMDAWLKKEAK